MTEVAGAGYRTLVDAGRWLARLAGLDDSGLEAFGHVDWGGVISEGGVGGLSGDRDR